jgi:hypothetical protein
MWRSWLEGSIPTWWLSLSLEDAILVAFLSHQETFCGLQIKRRRFGSTSRLMKLNFSPTLNIVSNSWPRHTFFYLSWKTGVLEKFHNILGSFYNNPTFILTTLKENWGLKSRMLTSLIVQFWEKLNVKLHLILLLIFLRLPVSLDDVPHVEEGVHVITNRDDVAGFGAEETITLASGRLSLRSNAAENCARPSRTLIRR